MGPHLIKYKNINMSLIILCKSKKLFLKWFINLMRYQRINWTLGILLAINILKWSNLKYCIYLTNYKSSLYKNNAGKYSKMKKTNCKGI